MDQLVNSEDIRIALAQLINCEGVELISHNISIHDNTVWTFTLSGQSYPTTFGHPEVIVRFLVYLVQSPRHSSLDESLYNLEKRIAHMLEDVDGVFLHRNITHSPLGQHTVDYQLRFSDQNSLLKLTNYSQTLFDREFTKDLEEALQED